MSPPLPDAKEQYGTESEKKLREPSMYKVYLHNDDYTSMDFVVDILKSVFHKTTEEAIQIMLSVHREGVGLCGLYTHEIAETKVDKVHQLARENEFPLRSSMEKA